jgi:hypothetical protein
MISGTSYTNGSHNCPTLVQAKAPNATSKMLPEALLVSFSPNRRLLEYQRPLQQTKSSAW